MARILVEATYDPPLAEAVMQTAEQEPDPDCYQIRNVKWLRSFVSRDRRRVICELEAPDADSVREAYRQAGHPFERVWAADILQAKSQL